jgi:hypothetical protein
MLEIKRQWNTLLDDARMNPGRDKWGLKNEELVRMQDEILRKNLSKDDMRRLAATCGVLPIDETNPNAFELNVLQFLVIAFVDAGERESLVTMLSTRFPPFVGPETTTEYYVLHSLRKAIPDPVLIFGEAYARSTVPEVRRAMAAVVRRGFSGFAIPGANDADFVENAMKWYESKKGGPVLRHTFTDANESFFEEDKNSENATLATAPPR